ncbi:MAG: hypothetical protein F4114_03030 [Rhodospirillaceae bacterium]|nr:hypothetical protein [Rhodospirillaceae bacterium]MYI48047.1 hypothetical protein [Rhodospirillaceae bacterium]
MSDATSDAPVSGPATEEKGSESRRARSIRFSDSEWEAVENAAKARGMNAAVFARHATLGVASGRYATGEGAFPTQYANLIERIFRSTHILVTLKRREMVRDGRAEELDELVRSTRELQKSVQEDHPITSPAVENRVEQ